MLKARSIRLVGRKWRSFRIRRENDSEGAEKSRIGFFSTPHEWTLRPPVSHCRMTPAGELLARRRGSLRLCSRSFARAGRGRRQDRRGRRANISRFRLRSQNFLSAAPPTPPRPPSSSFLLLFSYLTFLTRLTYPSHIAPYFKKAASHTNRTPTCKLDPFSLLHG